MEARDILTKYKDRIVLPKKEDVKVEESSRPLELSIGNVDIVTNSDLRLMVKEIGLMEEDLTRSDWRKLEYIRESLPEVFENKSITEAFKELDYKLGISNENKIQKMYNYIRLLKESKRISNQIKQYEVKNSNTRL